MTESPQANATPAALPQLVAAANAGDANAWNSLVERFRPLVHSVVRKYRLNETDIGLFRFEGVAPGASMPV